VSFDYKGNFWGRGFPLGRLWREVLGGVDVIVSENLYSIKIFRHIKQQYFWPAKLVSEQPNFSEQPNLVSEQPKMEFVVNNYWSLQPLEFALEFTIFLFERRIGSNRIFLWHQLKKFYQIGCWIAPGVTDLHVVFF